ncbi:hypothetical protein ACHMW6_22170 [Pseudoduganella sp. UC29_106]|uniref:hypothetical protein n=1 Tax=Pseudoduganella sp. UC29_106 TaxID=3374553 RepID=UPI003757972A
MFKNGVFANEEESIYRRLIIVKEYFSIKSIVRAIVSLLLLGAILSGAAVATDFQNLETRYGKIDATNSLGKVSIRYRDKVILKAEADGGSLFRITSDAGNEFVVVNFEHGGLNCRGFFHLIEISPSGVVKVSRDFGECYELGGAGFVAGTPVVHLKKIIDGNPPEMVSFLWRDGTISKIFESTDSCRSLSFSATSVSKKVNSNNMENQVGGAGRLQIYSAPSDACAKKGVFVLAGERLKSSLRFEDFAYVTYTNPKTGKKAEGWVYVDRLSPANK